MTKDELIARLTFDLYECKAKINAMRSHAQSAYDTIKSREEQDRIVLLDLIDIIDIADTWELYDED